jgi:DnaJ like chaperone protein
MEIEGVDGLFIDDDGFIWRGAKHRHQDIKSIRFRAVRTRHSVNLIPTGTTHYARLCLLMQNGRSLEISFSTRSFFDQTKQRRGMAGIWQAKEILCDASFSNRIAPFENDFRGRGYFTYSFHQFHEEGDVFQNGRRLFSVRDPGFTTRSSPFELHLCPRRSGVAKLIGNDTTLSTEEDEDCLYYMLRHAYGFTWEHQPIRSKVRSYIDPKNVFLTAMVKLAAKVAQADGSISTQELHTFKTHFGITTENFPEAGRIFNESARSEETPADIALAAHRAVKDSREFREYIVIGLLKIALADGHYHDQEHRIVESVAKALGFDEKDLAHILAICGIFSDAQENRAKNGARGAGSATDSDLVAYHCRVLGLNREATMTDIKISWRRLVQQHHPDRLHSLGIPVSDIKAAEETLKAINASYVWLKSFHAIILEVEENT